MLEDKTVMTNILIFGWSFLISVFAIPSIIYVAHLKNLLDRPNDRTVHHVLTPRLGGLAIFAGLMSSMMIFGNMHEGVQYLLAGCIILFFIGLKDDMVSVAAFKKFFVQILATGIVMFMGDIRVTSFQGIFGIHELSYGASYAFTFLVIVGITNALNLIDGLDGLAGSLVLLATGAFGYIFLKYGGDEYLPYAMISFALMGGVAGFLRYNFRNAIIFMGDTGSLVCGFILAVLAIQLVEMQTVEASPSVAISIICLPIFDTMRVFVQRIINGVSPFTPDKNHIHHILLRANIGQSLTVILLVLFSLTVFLFTMKFSYLGNFNLILYLSASFVLFTYSFFFFANFKQSKK